MRRMTHGEAYVFKRENIDFRKNFVQIQKTLGSLPAPMSRPDAIAYYGKKIRDYFSKEWGSHIEKDTK